MAKKKVDPKTGNLAVQPRKKAAKKKAPKRATPKQPQPQNLPGMEDKGIPELDALAGKALDAKDQQKNWKEKYDTYIHGLLSKMKEMKMDQYVHGGIRCDVVPSETTVKIKKVKEKRAAAK